MPAKTWTICDHARAISVSELDEKIGDLGTVAKRTLRGGLSEGVDVVTLDNGQCKVDILPTRGMSIWKAWAGDLEIGWQSPNRGPVHPAFVDMGEPSGLGWLDGFDEMMVRCGLESNGAPDFDENGQLTYPLHGRIGNKPAHHVQITADPERGQLSVTGIVEETRFHFLKLRMTSTITLNAKEPGFHIHDRVENFSASDAEMQMLYHANFGLPLLDAGSTVVAPVKTVVPRNDHAASGVANWNSYAAEEAGYEEQVYFLELLADNDGRTRTLLKNAHGTAGASMIFNKKVLPCFTVWKNTTAASDGYVTGLEPGTNFPNPRSYEGEQDRVVKLGGGKAIEFDLGFIFHQDEAAVSGAEAAVQALQGDSSPRVYDKPQAGWCAP